MDQSTFDRRTRGRAAIRKGAYRTPARPYTSKIIKAGALIGDAKTLLTHWDASAPVAENIDRIQRDNVFGKASRSRVEDILAIFRQRYLAEECVTKALVSLVRGKFEQRAEVAVIAWLRHQTTGYDGMVIPRVRGKRREVRQMLARRSQELLSQYLRSEPVQEGCPLHRALAVPAGV